MKSVISVTTTQADRNVSSGRVMLIPSHKEDNPTFLLTAALWFRGAPLPSSHGELCNELWCRKRRSKH